MAMTAKAAAGTMVDLGGGLKGFYARPAGTGPFPAVVVFIEAFGLNDHFKRVAGRFADAGYCAIVPDVYHGDVYAYDDLNNAIDKMKSLDDDTVMTESGRAIAYLEQQPEVRDGAVGCVGFCMGGRFAFLTNEVEAARVKAAVSFYGGGIGPKQDMVGRKPLLDRVSAMRAPILLLYGGKDASIAPDEHGRVAEALSAAGKSYTLTVFADAGHGFFCEDRQSYDARAAAERWQMTLDFYDRHLRT
jgi:carboxymethylenebutenolidase